MPSIAPDSRPLPLLAHLAAEEELAYAQSSPPRPAPHGRPAAALLSALAQGHAALARMLPPHLALRVPPYCVPGAKCAAAEDLTAGLRPLGPDDEGAEVLLWSPTRAALAMVRAAGARPVQSLALALGTARRSGPSPTGDPSFPTQEALARANDRATFAGSSPLPGGMVVDTVDGAIGHFAAAPAGSNWSLRRALSTAGRGARRIRASGGAIAPGDTAWLVASLARGSVTVDPVVSIERELAQHGWLEPDGALTLGSPCVQTVERSGRFAASSPLHSGESTSGGTEVAAALVAAALVVGQRLHDLGYWGPFGLDAYEWRDAATGALHLRAPSEVNARFTLGWWTGFGAPAGINRPAAGAPTHR